MLKAYKVSDRKGYTCNSVVIFAETAGKAISLALHTEEFCYINWDFTELKAVRIKSLDPFYRGNWWMDWDNDEDRVAMVKEAGFICDLDYAELQDCKECKAREWCSQYKLLVEEYEEMQLEEEKLNLEVCQDGNNIK